MIHYYYFKNDLIHSHNHIENPYYLVKVLFYQRQKHFVLVVLVVYYEKIDCESYNIEYF